MMRKIIAVILTIVLFLSAYATLAGQRLLEDERNTVKVFENSAQYVVFVHRIQHVTDVFRETHEVQTGTGSAFLWDDQGHVVTNYHLIRDAGKIAITLKKGKTVPAKILGADPRKDIAVLKLYSTEALPKFNNDTSYEIADSSKLIVGQKTIAIGNPFGLDRTLTTGIISALGREIPGYRGMTIRDMIQTDASINPGNSGGPLLNSRGELIGMNTAIFSTTGSSAGIGFAVPSNSIKRIVTQIIKHGRVIQPGLGINTIADRVAVQLNIKGVIIADVIPGGPAAKVGMRGTTRDNRGKVHIGDVIIGINAQTIRSYDDLVTILEKQKVGQKVEVKYLRKGEPRAVILNLIDVTSTD